MPSGESGTRRGGGGAGALAGAVIGAILRAAVVIYHLTGFGKEDVPAVLIALVIGAVVGAIGGAMRRVWLGVVVGGVVSLAVYFLLLPAGLILQFLKVGTVARPIEMVVIGAIAGGLGAAVGGRRSR